jgi:DNA-directed RNA polymerase subunit RPC12/RpoP
MARCINCKANLSWFFIFKKLMIIKGLDIQCPSCHQRLYFTSILFKENPDGNDPADTRVICACVPAWLHGFLNGVGHWVCTSDAMVRDCNR